MQTYTYSQTFKTIFTLVFAAVFCTVMGFLLFGTQSLDARLVLAAVAAGLGIFYAFTRNELNSSIIIDQYIIRYQSAFYTRELLLTDIKGYREHNGTIYLLSATPGKRRVHISGYLKNVQELKEWVTDKFIDVDEQEAIQAYNEVMEKEGALTGHQKIQQAKYITWGFNAASIGLAVFCFFNRHDIRLLPLGLIFLMLAMFFIVNHYKGLISLNEVKGQKTPDAVLTILVCCLGMFLSGIDIHYVYSVKIWQLVLPCTAVLSALLWYISRDFSIKPGSRAFIMAFYTLLFFAASWGSVLFLNVGFDKSVPQQYTAVIAKKRITRGKTTTYYLKLQPWGPVTAEEEESVPRSMYNAVDENGHLEIELYQGALGIPWYELYR